LRIVAKKPFGNFSVFSGFFLNLFEKGKRKIGGFVVMLVLVF